MHQIPRSVKFVGLEMDAKGHSQNEIAETLGISVDTLTRAKRNMRDFGDVETPEQKRGRKSKMDPGMQEVILPSMLFLIHIVSYCIYSTSTGEFEILYIIFGEDLRRASF
jgi:hypothetical protein